MRGINFENKSQTWWNLSEQHILKFQKRSISLLDPIFLSHSFIAWSFEQNINSNSRRSCKLTKSIQKFFLHLHTLMEDHDWTLILTLMVESILTVAHDLEKLKKIEIHHW